MRGSSRALASSVPLRRLGRAGIEALSRGAEFALFVDNGPEARALLRANVEVFALGGVTRSGAPMPTLLGKRPPALPSPSPSSIRLTTKVSPVRR